MGPVYRRMTPINDRHTVSAAEAAYTQLTKTWLPGKNPQAAETGGVVMQPPHRWYIHNALIMVLTSTELFKAGILAVIGAPIAQDTGAMTIARGIQQTGVQFVDFIDSYGHPVDYGIRWRIYGGLVAGDLVIFRCNYSELERA